MLKVAVLVTVVEGDDVADVACDIVAEVVDVATISTNNNMKKPVWKDIGKRRNFRETKICMQAFYLYS